MYLYLIDSEKVFLFVVFSKSNILFYYILICMLEYIYIQIQNNY